VYAVEIATGYGLAILVKTLIELARAGGLQDIPPCGTE
jgi:hypothetical protein